VSLLQQQLLLLLQAPPPHQLPPGAGTLQLLQWPHSGEPEQQPGPGPELLREGMCRAAACPLPRALYLPAHLSRQMGGRALPALPVQLRARGLHSSQRSGSAAWRSHRCTVSNFSLCSLWLRRRRQPAAAAASLQLHPGQTQGRTRGAWLSWRHCPVCRRQSGLQPGSHWQARGRGSRGG